MIREFWTENYLSIQSRQTMSFEVNTAHTLKVFARPFLENL